MATTTPNYGWPVPTSTDYVTNGATAIEDLGDAIDATVFGLPVPGATLVSTTLVTTGAATITIPSVFTTTYKSYLVTMFVEGGGTDIALRVTAGGSPVTGGNYNAAGGRVSWAGTNAWDGLSGTTSVTEFFNNVDTKDFATAIVYFNNPADSARYTTFHHTATVPNYGTQWLTGYYNATAAHDGFSITATSGNLTGEFRVYGLKA